MNVPSRFKLFGTTVTVRFAPEIFCEEGELATGFASYRKNEIQLRPSTSTRPLKDEQIEETFWHELAHFITYHAGPAYSGKTEFMHQDEGFIDIVGNLLHQAVSTFEYDK